MLAFVEEMESSKRISKGRTKTKREKCIARYSKFGCKRNRVVDSTSGQITGQGAGGERRKKGTDAHGFFK